MDDACCQRLSRLTEYRRGTILALQEPANFDHNTRLRAFILQFKLAGSGPDRPCCCKNLVL